MIDYILTVAVSVSAGVAAIVSAYPALHAYLVPISLGCTAIIAFANLRGMKESGAVFAIPTYAFLFGMITLIIVGTIKAISAGPVQQSIISDPGVIGKEATYPLIFIVLRAFAAGCTALTGIEAVSDGVGAFREPSDRNAARTLGIMGALLTVLFLGIGYLSTHLPEIALYGNKNPEYKTLSSQIAAWAFGAKSVFFYFLQYATAAILVLAANTAFADFPRLSSFLSRDGFLPRAFARQGDKLVFQNGIVLLSLASMLLIYLFHGELDQLLPLYAVGVFLAFTLSQSGMLRYFMKRKRTVSAVISGIGAVVTGIVMFIILITKFTEGAWIVVILLAILFVIFRAIKSRYASITRQLTSTLTPGQAISHHTVLLLVPRVHRGVLKALNYALGLHGDVRALHVSLNQKTVPQLKEDWLKYGGQVPLVVVSSSYRSLIDPVLEYVDQIHAEKPDETVTVIVPEAVNTRWYHKILQENVAFQLKLALGGRKNVVLTNVRYFLE
jgi:amino acid transporter